MPKIIITGGAGYIGSHTAVEFLLKGFEVVIVDDLSNSRLEVIDGIEQITKLKPLFYRTDVTDLMALDNIISEHKDASAIVHFAAYKAVGESVKQPLMYYNNNLVGLLNILKLINDYQISNFVFSSSCTVYGQPKKLPVTEQSPIVKPESPYGNTKKIGEEIITDAISASTNLKAVSLRYFNPIGAHPSALIGELPIGVPNNLMPYITQTAIGIRPQLKVFGNDYNTPDGTAIRDYINVVDLAKAHVVAVARLISNKNEQKYEVFNIGTGKGVSVLEVINAFEKSTGVKLNYEIAERREGDVEKVWADTTKANSILGWFATESLEDTVKSAWEWERQLRNIE
jgi:UDP-glucose 4-epimerase